MSDPKARAQDRTQRVGALGLYLNDPEPAIICRLCKFALNGTIGSVVKHLAEKHNSSTTTRKELDDLLRPYTLLEPKKLPLRPDGSPPHPHLVMPNGFACKHCHHKTTSINMLSRRLSKFHMVKRRTSTWLRDHVVEGIFLQSWDRNGAYGYWIVQPDVPVPDDSQFDNSLLQKSAPRLSRLEQLHQSERERMTEQHVAIVNDVGSTDMALNTNWMRRTSWSQIIADGNRKLLVELAQLPYGAREDLFLGIYGNTNLFSRREDEERLMVMVAALDRAFDRCEDTVKHTDTSIRCWLRGQYLDRPHKAPFELVGRKPTTDKYRRLMKRCICFCVRLWRLEDDKRQSLLRRSLTESQCEALIQVWSDKVWSFHPVLHGQRTDPGHVELNDADPEDESDDASLSTDESDTQGRSRLQVRDHDSRSGLSESDDGESKNGSAYMDTTPTEPPYIISSRSNTANNSTTSKESSADSVLEDLVLRLGHFLVTEEYEDGQPCSTLLVYFSSVLGISADGSTFERAVHYTPKLSGMIYCARLIFLESTLARFAHHYIGWKARPRRGQLEHLNEVRREKMCLGSQAPMGES